MAKAAESGIAALRKDVNALKKEVGQLTRETPIDPAQAQNMAAAMEAQAGEKADFLRVTRGNADYGGPVQSDIQRAQSIRT